MFLGLDFITLQLAPNYLLIFSYCSDYFDQELTFKLEYKGECRRCKLPKPVYLSQLIIKGQEFFGSLKDIYHLHNNKVKRSPVSSIPN